MVKKVQYTDELNRKSVIDANVDLTLIEEQNIIDGNFLIFTDVKPLENQLQEQQENQLVLMDVLGTMYEDMLAKGTV